MKFNYSVTCIALFLTALNAGAQDGLLRRSTTVAQNETAVTVVETQPKTGVVILNSNTNTTSASMASAPQAQTMPATVVEAQPAVESKAEVLRKARAGAEVQTEQKIVEKLEESRMKEEQERADRLFGNKYDAPPAAAAAVSPAPVVVPAQAPMVVPAQPAAAAKTEEKPQPAQVTIERVEIIQPMQSAPAEDKFEDVKDAKTVSKKADEVAPVVADNAPKYYMSASVAGINYDASNVKSNGGVGFAIGTLMDSRLAVEGTFMYSNHFIDTFWETGLYRELNQYDIGIVGKYYLMTDKIRPFLGAGIAYIDRQYRQRLTSNNSINPGTTGDETTAVNGLLVGGVDFALASNFSLGGDIEYSQNIMNRNAFNFSSYGLPSNTKALEEISYYALKITGKFTF